MFSVEPTYFFHYLIFMANTEVPSHEEQKFDKRKIRESLKINVIQPTKLHPGK